MGREKAKWKGNGSSSNASDFSMDADEMRIITTTFDRYNLNLAERLAFDKAKEAEKEVCGKAIN